MSSKTVFERPNMSNDATLPTAAEQAPSYTKPAEPTVLRVVGMLSIVLAVVGTMAIGFVLAGRPSRFIGLFWGSLFVEIGLLGMLLHAAADHDIQIRRTYTIFGFLLLASGIVLSVLGIHTGGLILWGLACLVGALLFLTVANRHETETEWRNSTTFTLGAVGAVLALVGLIGGNLGQFLTPVGLVLAALGLAYLCCFVVSRGVSDNLGYWVGVGMGIVGGMVMLTAVVRSFLPGHYFLPNGFLLIGLGFVYAAASALLCSDNRTLVMTRRELASFFFSPVAYIAFLVWTVVGGFQFAQMVEIVAGGDPSSQVVIEPIVRYYFLSILVVIPVVVVVPMLTMRLLSEEKRSGTLEVMLTAPVSEISLVLSKFLAASIFFALLSVPWGIFLLSLRVGTGQPFDYLPLLSFMVANLAIGAGLMAMGLFFSALTQHQLVSFALTFGMMLAFTAAFFMVRNGEGTPGAESHSVMQTVLRQISYIHLWIDALNGRLAFKYVVYHVTAAVFWLFATVKVLDARKWA
jgi:ABC-2 type transport system permease protein